MAVIRGPLPSDNYTMVSNAWARDADVSLKAKGLLLAISSHQQGYRLTIKQLIAQNKDGRDSIYAGLRELVDAGYMVVLQNRSEGGQMAEVDYVLTGKLGHDDEGELPEGEQQARSRKRRRRSEPFTENPDTADDEGSPPPSTDFPDTAEPLTEDPTHRRSLPKKTNSKKTNVTSRNVAAAVDNSGEQRPLSNMRSPRPAAPQPFRTEAQAQIEETLNTIDEDEVERTLLYLPDKLRPTRRDAMRLRGLIVQRMQRGWSREAILDAVAKRLRDGGTLDNPCGLFAAVLVPLNESPTAERSVETQDQPSRTFRPAPAPWCGHCDEKTRFLLDESGFPDNAGPKCPECEQLAFAEHMQRGAS